MLLGDRSESQEVAAAGIGEQHVDRARLGLNDGEQAIEVGELRDVALDAAGAVADLRDRGVELLLPPPRR